MRLEPRKEESLVKSVWVSDSVRGLTVVHQVRSALGRALPSGRESSLLVCEGGLEAEEKERPSLG